MCVIERFISVQPNGTRQPENRLRPCARGTPTTPCNNVRIVDREDHFIPDRTAPFPPPSQIHVIEPQIPARPRRQEPPKRNRRLSDDLRLVFAFHVPFTTRKDKTSKPQRPKREFVLVKRRGRQGHIETLPAHVDQQTPQPPLPPSPPPPHFVPQERPHVVQVPLQRPIEHVRYPPREPEVMHPRPRQPIPIPSLIRRDEEDSPPPMSPHRQHRRQRSRTLSPPMRYEENKRLQRETELRLHAERVAREAAEEAAHARREAEITREERNEALRRNNELERERRRLERSENLRIESAERERRRRSHEERERIERERRERRVREQERRRADEQERLRAQRDADEEERLRRARRAGIRRGPHHPIELHQGPGGQGSLEEQGSRVIQDAVRAEHLRQADGNAPTRPARGWFRRRDVGGGLRRRDTVAVGERTVYGNDARRVGRRWL